MRNTRTYPKHIKPDAVDEIYRDIAKARISQAALSRDLGISRTTLHLMFKHELPMRRVYGLAITQVLMEKEDG